MGPLFALMALALVGGAASLATFLVAIFFLPFRSALLLSPIFSGSGLGGVIVGLLVQPLFISDEPSSAYLGVGMATGCVCATACALIFLRIRREILAACSATSRRRQASLFD
jgi:hypothetical protein